MKTLTDCFVSVVAPLCNDADIVESFVSAVMSSLQDNFTNYELVLVDDWSEDETVSKVTNLLSRYRCIRLVRLSKRFGEEIALSAALDSAIGDFVVLMLPNSDPPDLIPETVQRAQTAKRILFGIRCSRDGEGPIMRLGAMLFYWYCERVLKINLPKNSTQFRVLSRQAVNAIMQIKVRNRYLRTLIADIGFDTETFTYEPINRRGGKPRKKSLFKNIGLGISIMINVSQHPLRLVSWFGVLAGTVNLLYVGFVTYSYLFGENIAPGWTTLSLQTAVMFFFVFLILTVLTEYIGHILIESDNRPLYYVHEERNSSVLLADEDRKNVVRNSLGDDYPQPVTKKAAR